mgnify:FL=1|tara:strand:- start:952 stop:1200 length:249 start_codon:yes stop_codon:yes gene_type:complete
MKIILIIITLSIQIFGTSSIDSISNRDVIKNNWTKTTICKNGYIIVKVIGTKADDKFSIEYPLCTIFSVWNSKCKHKPLVCK